MRHENTAASVAHTKKTLLDAAATCELLRHSFAVLLAQLAAADHAARTPQLIQLVREIGGPAHHWQDCHRIVTEAISDAIRQAERPASEPNVRRLISRRRSDREDAQAQTKPTPPEDVTV